MKYNNDNNLKKIVKLCWKLLIGISGALYSLVNWKLYKKKLYKII